MILHMLLQKIKSFTTIAAALFVLINVAVVTLNVLLRYVFDIGIVALQELEWWSYSLIFLLGATATLFEDRHVRIDILIQRLSPSIREKITLYGTLIFLLPFCLAFLPPAFRFAWNSFLIREQSSDPGGMPAVYLIKAAIPLSLVFLIIAGTGTFVQTMLRAQKKQ